MNVDLERYDVLEVNLLDGRVTRIVDMLLTGEEASIRATQASNSAITLASNAGGLPARLYVTAPTGTVNVGDTWGVAA